MVLYCSLAVLLLRRPSTSEYSHKCCAAQSYVILRQHYLTGGEDQINEWHRLFLEKGPKNKQPNMLRMLNVNQVCII